jgi:hypothetical protein
LQAPEDEQEQIGALEYTLGGRVAIRRLVKFFHGYKFSIAGPCDWWNALTEMVARDGIAIGQGISSEFYYLFRGILKRNILESRRVSHGASRLDG